MFLIDTYLDKTESKIASTVIYDRETRLEPFRKTKSSLLLSDIFIYVDEFFFIGKDCLIIISKHINYILRI